MRKAPETRRVRRRARARRASWAGPGAPRRSRSRWTGSTTSQQQPWCLCWTQPRSATAVQHKADGQQARDEQQQQRSGRREGRMQHDGAHEPASIAATSGASDATAAAFRVYLSICLYTVSASCLLILLILFMKLALGGDHAYFHSYTLRHTFALKTRLLHGRHASSAAGSSACGGASTAQQRESSRPERMAGGPHFEQRHS